MANISAIKLPNGTTYNLKDSISGYTTNTGTITQVQTTAGAHTTINVSSGAATFNVPTKTSHLTNDSGFITASHTSTYSLPIAKYDTLGGVLPAYTSTNSVTLTTAAETNTTTPTIQAKSTTSTRYYAVEADKDGVLFVNIPWQAYSRANTVQLGMVKPAYTTTGTASLTTASAQFSNSPTIATRTTTSGRFYAIEIDSNGRLFANIPWTDTKVTTAALTSETVYYPILATGTGTATRQIDSTLKGFTYKATAGTTSTIGTSILQLGNSTTSGTANNQQGQLLIYGSTAYAHTIQGAPTAARTLTLPDAGGTIALTNDIYESVSLTQAEYDALPLTDKNDSKKIYYITDSNPTPTVNEMLNTFYPIGTCYETYNSSFDPTSEWGGDWTVEEINSDEIIEEGSANSTTSPDTTWTWRKWSSGITECWGRTTNASAAYAANTPVQVSRSLPANIFKSGTLPSITVAGGITGVPNSGIAYTYTNGQSVQVYLINRTGSSVTNTAWVTYYFAGIWKTQETLPILYRWKRIS